MKNNKNGTKGVALKKNISNKKNSHHSINALCTDKDSLIDIICIIVLLLIYVEWFPYFLFSIINFYAFDAITIFQIISLAGAFLLPFYVLLSTYLNHIGHKGMRIKMIIRWLGGITVLPFLVLLWITHNAYFQIGSAEDAIINGLDTTIPMVGIMADFRLNMAQAMFGANFLLFYLITPSIIMQINKNTDHLPIGNKSTLSIGITALYLALRWGSFTGTPLRILNVFTILFFCLIMVEIFAKSGSSEILESTEGNIRLKMGRGRFLFIITGLFLGAVPISMNGMMGNSWIWFSFAIGAILRLFIGKRRESHGTHSNKILSKNLTIGSFLLLILMALLLISCQINGILLHMQPYLICVAGFFFSFSLPSIFKMFAKESGKHHDKKKSPLNKKGFQSKKGRTNKNNQKDHEQKLIKILFKKFDWTLWFLIGYAMVFIAGIQDPISSWGVLAVLGVYSLFMIYVVIKD